MVTRCHALAGIERGFRDLKSDIDNPRFAIGYAGAFAPT
jgi:hypothetical protein